MCSGGEYAKKERKVPQMVYEYNVAEDERFLAFGGRRNSLDGEWIRCKMAREFAAM
jgi:hypothetical protein